MSSFRLSPQQRRLWHLFEQGVPRSAAVAVRLPQAGEAEVRDALGLLVERHQALRTGYQTRPGLKIPLQVVSGTPDLTWLPPSAAPLAERLAEERGRTRAAGEPPLRAGLLTGDGPALLLLALPALSADAWSLGNFAADLVALLAGEDCGGEVLQYPRFAGFQNELAEEDDEDREAALAHWRRVLTDTGSLELRLPLAEGRGGDPFTPSPAGVVDVDRDVLERVAGRLELPPETVVGAAWEAYLARLCGGEVTVGHLLAGRDYEILEAAYGLFARAVPRPVPGTGAASFAELAADLAGALDEAAEAADHLDLGEHLRADGEIPRFDALYQADTRWPSAGDAAVVAKEVTQEPFLVRLVYAATADGPRLELSTDGGRLAPEAAARLRSGFVTFLAAALRSPRRPWGELPLMDTDERRRLLDEVYVGTPLETGLPTVVERIAEAARRGPDEVAVIGEDGTLTRGELARRSGQLAGHLRRLGVGPEVAVGLCFERSTDLVVAMAAVLEAGGAYVPIEPELPAPRRAAVLIAADAPVLLTHRGLATEAPEGCTVVDLDEDAISGDAATRPTPPDPASKAYVIFTSGSTGVPKGVVVEHRQLSSYLAAVEHWLDLPAGRSHTFAMVSSPAADSGHTVLFPALCGGGPLLLVGAETSTDPEALASLMRTHPADVLKIVSSHLGALLAGGDEAAAILPRQRLVCGGETLEPRLVESVRRLAPELQVFNHYGPTEATVGVLTYEVDRWTEGGSVADVLPRQSRSVPVGRPLAGCRTYLVDPSWQPVPLGAEGELMLGGLQVARGYAGRPGLTAAAFVPDPLAAEPGARAYVSGDLARLLPPGVIEFSGRSDDQVKIRGFRIEPAEVARHVELHPEVRAAHVQARPDAAGRPRLVAWVEGTAAADGGGAETLPNGLRVEQLNRNETRHLYDQIFVDRIYDRYGTVYEEDAVIFDVGANIGMFSLFANLRCRRPRIFAFEPSPYAFDKLRRNIERYGVDAHLYAAGMADREGTAEMTVYPRASVMSGFHADREAEERLFRDAFAAEGHDGDHAEASELAAGRFEAETLTRPLTTVSAVIREHGLERIDLLKLDVEKAELEVLQGIEEQDWPKIRQLLLEVHDLGDRLERIRRMLADRGYRVVLEEDPDLAGTGIFHVHASRLPAAETVEPPALAPPPTPGLSADGLTALLRRTLPEHMVPAHFVFLERLPLTRNGKVDRAALPDPETVRETPYVPPSTNAERRLAEIWSKVLRRDRVSVEDNFFELGGDSILSIQVAAQARRAGLRLATRQLFRFQTIRELAAAVDEGAVPGYQAEQGRVEGAVPPTPIQRWFYDEGYADPHHFNQSVLLTVREPLDDGVLRRTVARLVEHHDALRLRVRDRDGGVVQEIVAEAAAPFGVFDLSALPPARRPAAVAAASAGHQRSLHLERGPLLRVAHFDFGAGETGRLLVVVHHLVMDGVSWRILLADLENAYRSLAAGGEADLPAKTTSFLSWAERLQEHAAAPSVAEEVSFWLRQTESTGPLDDAPDDAPAAARVESLAVSLDPETTGALVTEVPASYQVQVPELLVAALVGAHRRVDGGGGDLSLVLEGHGREDLFEDVDLSRTVGWFTTHYPVRLDLEAGSGSADPGERLKTVKETLRGVPGGGLGYGLLRHLAPASQPVEKLRRRRSPALKLNYLGRFDQVLSADSPFSPAFEDRGRDRSPRAHRPYPLEVDSLVGDGRLQTVWTYDPERFPRRRIRALADAFLKELGVLVEHCLSGKDSGYTPSDFPLADLEQSALEEALLEADFEMRGDG